MSSKDTFLSSKDTFLSREDIFLLIRTNKKVSKIDLFVHVYGALRMLAGTLDNNGYLKIFTFTEHCYDIVAFSLFSNKCLI